MTGPGPAGFRARLRAAWQAQPDGIDMIGLAVVMFVLGMIAGGLVF